jgi:hypothetical protein
MHHLERLDTDRTDAPDELGPIKAGVSCSTNIDGPRRLFVKLKTMVRAPIIVDLRNFLSEEQVEQSGFSFGIGGRGDTHSKRFRLERNPAVAP